VPAGSPEWTKGASALCADLCKWSRGFSVVLAAETLRRRSDSLMVLRLAAWQTWLKDLVADRGDFMLKPDHWPLKVAFGIVALLMAAGDLSSGSQALDLASCCFWAFCLLQMALEIEGGLKHIFLRKGVSLVDLPSQFRTNLISCAWKKMGEVWGESVSTRPSLPALPR
jgi:hypothetical protein